MPYGRARHISPLRSFWRHDGAIKVSRRGLGNRHRSLAPPATCNIPWKKKEAGKGGQRGKERGRGVNPICVSGDRSVGESKIEIRPSDLGKWPFHLPVSLARPNPEPVFTRLSVVKHEESLVLRLARSLSASSRREDSCSLARVSRFPLPSQIELNLNDTSSLSSSPSSLVSCAVSRRLAVKSFLLFALISGVHGLD